MSASSKLKAKLVRVHVKQESNGLFVATSSDLKGLLVGARAIDDLDRKIARAIIEMYDACGLKVYVTKMEQTHECDDGAPWIAFPAELAKQSLRAEV